MFFVKKVPLFVTLCIWYIIYVEITHGLQRDRRSPQWGFPSSLLGTGQNSRNVLSSVGGVNLSPTQIKQIPQQSTSNSATQLLRNDGQINQNLGSATSTLSNVYSAVPTNNDEKNKKSLLGLGSEPLINAGIDDESTWLAVAGQDILLAQNKKSSDKNKGNAEQPIVQPNSIPQIPSDFQQQNNQNLQQSASSLSKPEDVINESRFSEELATRKPQKSDFDPNMFQVKPIRPENEINKK